MGVAVLANCGVSARVTIVVTSGKIDLAGLISDVGLMHKLESIKCLTSVTTIISHIARDDDLGGDVYIGPGGLSADLDSI